MMSFSFVFNFSLSFLKNCIIVFLGQKASDPLQSSDESLGENQIKNVASGSGGRRGVGAFSGSGSVGTLPPCKDCFGHGSNPNSNPNCHLGCRGINDAIVVTPFAQVVMHRQCSGGANCHRNQAIEDPGRGDDEGDGKSKERDVGKNTSKLKNGIIIATIVGCILIVIVLTVKKIGHRVSQVGARGRQDSDGIDLKNIQTV